MVGGTLSLTPAPSRGFLVCGVLLLLLLVHAVRRTSACVDTVALFDEQMSVHFDHKRNGTFPIPCSPFLRGQFTLERVSWRFGNATVGPSSDLVPGSETTNRLVYRRFDDSRHAGWYQCLLTYRQGVLVSPRFQVARDSMSQPRLLLSHGRPSLPARGAALVVLECRVDRVWPSSLLPTFLWYRNGRRLWPKGQRDMQQLPCDRQQPAATSCLYLWSFDPRAEVSNFSCGAVLGRNHRNSSVVEVGPATVTDHVFPDVVGPVQREWRDVLTETHVALACARGGVVAFGQTRWAVNGSDQDSREIVKAVSKEVEREHRHFLLVLNTKELRTGHTYNLTCAMLAASPSAPRRILRHVSVRVFPKNWHVWRCSQTVVVKSPGSRLALSCIPTTPNDYPNEACSQMMGSILRRMDSALPVYSVSWFLNGRRLRQGDDAGIQVDGPELRVSSLSSAKHSGIFQCRVETPLGDERWANYVVMVRKAEKPRWERLEVSAIGQTFADVSVRLSGMPPLCGQMDCVVKGDSQDLKPIRSSESSVNLIMVLDHLQPFYHYRGACNFLSTSSGGVRLLSQSPEFEFRTREGRPTAQPDFQVAEERPGALLIRWQMLHASHAMGVLTRHRVLWRLASNTDPFSESADLPAEQTQLLLSGLLGNALYEVAVESGTRVGYPRLQVLGRRLVTMRAHTLSLHPRGFLPRLPVIRTVDGSGVNFNLSVSWTAKRRQVVHRWNVTVHFSLRSPRRSVLLPGTANHTLVPAPGTEKRALVWLEAQDSRGRVIDDWVGVMSLYSFPMFELGPAQPIRAPTNVSVSCTPGRAALVVRWSAAGQGSLCVSARSGPSIGLHACYVRVRLIPLPVAKHRVRIFLSLSPYANASAVAAGRLTVTGLRVDTVYAVGVAFVRPPLSSAFAVPEIERQCRVHAPALPVPTVQLRRLDADRVRVMVAARQTPSVRLVALRLCSADAQPLPGLDPQFAKPDQAATSGVVLRLQTTASFLQAACCYEQNRCAEWSPMVSLRAPDAGPATERPGPSPVLSPWQLAGLGLLLLAVGASAVALVLAIRMRRLRAELRRRPADSANTNAQPEAQPFV